MQRGEIVVVTDDENRENEGDLIMAAEKVTEAAINFMAKHGRGLICVALTRDRLERLGLSRMTTRGKGDAFGTAFMESVDAADGITTGISAADRARDDPGAGRTGQHARRPRQPRAHVSAGGARGRRVCGAPGTRRRRWTWRRWPG